MLLLCIEMDFLSEFSLNTRLVSAPHLIISILLFIYFEYIDTYKILYKMLWLAVSSTQTLNRILELVISDAFHVTALVAQ